MSSTLPVLPGLEAHPSGAAFLPASRTLLIADLHLGYSWAQRRRGELGPMADERTRRKLYLACAQLNPERIVFLGDVVHAPRPCLQERTWIRETLEELSRGAQLIAVRGNHDRAFPRDFSQLPVETVAEWRHDNLLAIHGDRPAPSLDKGELLVLGHFHPSVPIVDAAGAAQRLPAFLVTSRCAVLPAFSPFAKGFDVASGLPAYLRSHFGGEEIEAYAATATRVVRLGSLSRLLQHMDERNVGAPKQFRRAR